MDTPRSESPMSSDGEARFTPNSNPGSSSPQESQAQPESVNDSEPIQIDDDPETEDTDFGTKRKLTSVVWKDFKKVKVLGVVKAQCLHCHKQLGGTSKNGTTHLHDHLKICTLKKIKLMGQNKSLAQSSLRFSSQQGGKVSVGSYTFDQEVARRELAAMIILHEYPLSMVDHTGFRRFVSALQPLFKMVTRNTIRKDIMDAYKEERKTAIEYMAGSKSRVAITTDMWTSDNQRRGYMAITAHFIDDSWSLRNIIMRFIYVPAPHTAEVICEELYEALVCEVEEDEDNTESTAPSLANSGVLSTISARVASRRPTAVRFKSELDRYLDDELVPINTENFKILDWWKVAGTRYPTLRKIARDIYAIPVTTVASESAFSTSGRVLSEHRSRLTPEILEALMCSQDWLRNKYKGDNEETANFWTCLQEIQDGMEGLALL